MKTNLKGVSVALTTGVQLGSLTVLSLSRQRQQESALKSIDID
jgi:hypothetical protein